MTDTTVAAPVPWEEPRRPRPTWGFDEGDENGHAREPTHLLMLAADVKAG